MLEKAKFFIQENKNLETPYLILSLSEIEKKYKYLSNIFNFSHIHYAVKANPNKKIVSLCNKLGSFFDCASFNEIKLCLEQGVNADEIIFGNTIKKSSEIKQAYQLGIKTYAVDCLEELEKIAKFAPKSKVYCRIAVNDDGAESDWALSKKFGCNETEAIELLKKSLQLNLKPIGVSFHVGSQMRGYSQWRIAIEKCKEVFQAMEDINIKLHFLNMGGGIPVALHNFNPDIKKYRDYILKALQDNFKEKLQDIDIIIEPGRSLVADSGILCSSVIAQATRKKQQNSENWLYIDAGKFNGLIETIGEAIKYDIIPLNKESELQDRKYILAGPTCDGEDVMYQKNPYMLPSSLKSEDKLLFLSTGAYTSSYASVSFNGFEPIKEYFCD